MRCRGWKPLFSKYLIFFCTCSSVFAPFTNGHVDVVTGSESSTYGSWAVLWKKKDDHVTLQCEFRLTFHVISGRTVSRLGKSKSYQASCFTRLLLWLARQSGTLSRTFFWIQMLLRTTSSACWKRFCFQRSSAISGLDVLRQCALQKLTFYLLTYLLTYLLRN